MTFSFVLYAISYAWDSKEYDAMATRAGYGRKIAP